MASKTTQAQIYKELNPYYAPQVKSLQSQMGLIPGQIEADVNAAKGAQTQAFDDILGGTRQRGLGFSGIPLSEQAKYSSNVFAPSVLRARNEGQNRRFSLQDAILGIRQQQNQQATQMYQWGRGQALSEKQFKEGQRQFNVSRKGSGGGGGGYSLGGYGGTPTPTGVKSAAGIAVPKALQSLYNQVFIRPDGNSWTDRDLVSDYNATFKSAGYGNAADKKKLELYHLMRPDLFGGSIPSAVLANSGRLSF